MLSLEPGAVLLDRYELDAFLGEGGMGTVWSARHRVTGKRVALKILKSPLAEQRKRFLREARVAAAIVHPNLVEVHDVLELDGGHLLLVMDLLEGEVLADRLEREGAMSLRSLAQILLPIVGAVGAAHAAGVVHRDLKPDNVFLARSGPGQPPTVKVLDFGIAKLTSDFGEIKHTAGLTQTGSVLGTPTYMAPEQVYGERDVDHRADVWSLGVMAYECLAGRCPIEGDNVGQIFKSISQRSFGPLATVVPTLPDAVAQLVDRMLASKPSDRPGLVEVATVFARATGLEAPEVAPPRGEAPTTAPASGHHRTPLALATTLAAPTGLLARRWIRWSAGVAALSIAVALVMWGSRTGTPAPVAGRDADGVAAAIEAEADRSPAPPAAAPSTPIVDVSPDTTSTSILAPPRAADAPVTSSKVRVPAVGRTEGSSAAAASAAPSTLPGGIHGASPY